MVHTPREKLLPEDIAERSDHDVAEELFGKAATEELDRLIAEPTESMPEC